jgi:CheY-like chemotaxis protein
MAVDKRSVLMVGVADAQAAKICEILARADVFAERIADPSEALELTRQLPFDAVIIGYPLVTGDLYTLLKGVRQTSSPSRHAAVLLLASRTSIGDAREYVGRGVNRVVSDDDPEQILQGAVAELLGVAPRIPLRVPLRVEAALDKGMWRSLCQTENLSMTGMLVRTPQAFPEGTQVRFEITLPNDIAPLRGQGVVVRQADYFRERVHGVGVRLVSFDEKGRRRYESYIQSLTPDPW